MNIQIPFPEEAKQDLRKMITDLAQDVIQDLKGREAIAKDYMTVKDTCRYLNISFSTLQNFQNLGLKKCKIEGKILFRRQSIDDFMKEFEK